MSRDERSPAGADAPMRRQLRWLWATVIGLGVLWLSTAAWLVTGSTLRPPVLTAERLEIVEPDGALAFVIANSQRPVAATLDGQTLMGDQEEARRGIPSIIFFDGKGDEVGGMLFGVRETSKGYNATRHLSLDGHGQDQTVVLAHYQDPAGSTSGLTVSDRPAHSMLEMLGQLGLEPGASSADLSAAITAIPEDVQPARRRELFGTTRAFVGRARGGEAALVLRDGEGRQRIVIEAPDEGEPSIRILDAGGNIVLRLPDS